jgi:hypothetical protein
MKAFSVKVFQILSSKIYDLTIAHNFDDPRSEGPITSRFLLNSYTRASLQVAVHTFAPNTPTQFQPEIPEKFAEICSLLRTNRNSLCEKLAIFPLRLFSSALINKDCVFSSNVDLIRSLASIFYGQNLSIQGARVFVAIQTLYGLSEKEQFVANIAELFGLESDYDFWFLWMLECLVFDKISLSDNHQQMEMLQAVTHLRRRPMSLTELHSEMKMDSRKCHNFIEKLPEYTKRRVPSFGRLQTYGIHFTRLLKPRRCENRPHPTFHHFFLFRISQTNRILLDSI